MLIDPRTPLLTQVEAAAATDLSMKTIDNYIQHGFLIPARLERRRVFSARQIARLSFVAMLNSEWQVPPATAFKAADRLLALPLAKTVLGRATDVPEDASWIAATSGEERVRLVKQEDSSFSVEAAGEDAPGRFVSLEIAPHGFLRHVLWRCAEVLRARDPVALARAFAAS